MKEKINALFRLSGCYGQLKKMKKITLTTLILSLPILGNAQSQKSFEGLVKKLEVISQAYDTLYAGPSEIMYDLSQFNFTKIEKQIIKEEYAISIHNDSIEAYLMIDILKSKLFDLVPMLFNHSKFESNFSSELFKNVALDINVSDDNKLFNLSFDAKNGGSYRDRESFVFYLDTNLIDVSDLLSDDGYYKIDQINTIEGTKYLLIGSVQGCNTCTSNYLSFIHFKDASMNVDFEFKVATRGWNNSIEFNTKDSIITIIHETSDYNPSCYCENDEDYENSYNGDFDYTKRKECICQFKLIDANFKLVKESWELIEK